MKVINTRRLEPERVVLCPRGGFVSHRALLRSDGLGFTLTRTEVPAGTPQHWHYPHHLEACYCTRGTGWLTDLATGQRHLVTEGFVYVLDQHDDHTFQAVTDVELVCVFNPPLEGHEVHSPDGTYPGVS